MANSDKIISIDISSKKVKVGIISDKLELESASIQGYSIIDEDINGFAKQLNMDKIWNKVDYETDIFEIFKESRKI